jgi:N-acetylmuramoyl-L-alanine amidase
MALALTADGWLAGDARNRVVRIPTVRTTPLEDGGPFGIVWHYTGGGAASHAEALARRIQTYRRGLDRPASWHLLVARDGTLYQSAPFSTGTWHVGKPGVVGDIHFDNVNRALVGCELENAGRLRKLHGRWYCHPYWLKPAALGDALQPDPGCEVHESRVRHLPEGMFDSFTPEQEDVCGLVLGVLVGRYGWTRELSAFGHVDLDPARREDPGPVWRNEVLPRVLAKVFGPVEERAS